MNRRPRVLLGICGGIAAYKAVELVRRLGEHDFEVRCALTRSAKSFLQPLTLEVLSGHAVYEQEYLTATGRGEESHIALAAWADVFCVAPATANFLGRLALGLADDFLTTTALGYRGPMVVAPAMHHEMWFHPAVVRNVALLEERGVRFVGPVEGALASGERGMGRFADPLEIAAAVDRAWRRGELEGRTVLVSAGPTREPIDPVRYLGNHSSGKMGFAIADEAARRGARVILVAGPVSLPTPVGVERINVETALEMRDALGGQAAVADLIVMTAAVADFRPRRAAGQKIKKERGVPEIELEANPDILTELADIAPRALRVGFAAETAALAGENQEGGRDADEVASAARAKLERKRADFLVWNNVADKSIGFGSEHNEVVVYRRGVEPRTFERRPKSEIAAELMTLFCHALEERTHKEREREDGRERVAS